MFSLKIFGNVLRGRLNTRQLRFAAVLGTLLGFVPGFALPGDLGGGFMQAPGLILFLLFGVLILNCNMAVFSLTLFMAKACSLPLMGLSFSLGQFLLDGPLGGLLQGMINAPVLAWFGLEYYATTGGLLLGLILGLLWASFLCRSLVAFRNKMAQAEENSAAFQKYRQKRWVKVMTWAFIGGDKGKKSYRELFEQNKKGLPIRVPGVLLVLVLIIGLWLLQSTLSGPLLRTALRSGLEQANGATVDLDKASWDLADGKVTIQGLAMADPQALFQDLFRSLDLELDMGTTALLSRRLVVDKLVATKARSGAKRESPGKLIAAAEPPPPPPAEEGEESKTLEEYLAEAKVWKERLQQISRWLETIAGSGDGEEEDLAESIQHQVEKHGYAMVAAKHLIDGTPSFLIKELVMEGVVLEQQDGNTVDIRAENLSTHPHLVKEPIKFSIQDKQGNFGLTLTVAAGGEGKVQTQFFIKGLPADDISGQLKTKAMQGGNMDLSLDGVVDCQHPQGVWLDNKLQVQLHDTTLTVMGKSEKISNLSLPLGLRGPLASPRVSLDTKALPAALLEGQKDKLIDEVEKKVDEELKKHLPGGLFGDK